MAARAPSISDITARARATARPVHVPSGLGTPLFPSDVLRLERLEHVAGRRASWGRDAGGLFFVDLDPVGDEKPDRFQGESLGLAIGAAIRAERGRQAGGRS
jgi:hypothetical protein